MNNDKQLLPLITPEMFRTMPDQTCDILNRLIRFYQEYQKESSTAIQNNFNSINSLNTAITDIVIPTVGNGQLTVRQNGATIGTFTANQSSNTAINITTPTDFNQIGGTINGSKIEDNTTTSDKLDWTTLINKIYPVGSIYMSVNNVSPSTFIGGTWERIQDTFLLAAGSIYSAGATGGEATHTLTIDEIPSHQHTAEIVGITAEGPGDASRGDFYRDSYWNRFQTSGDRLFDYYGEGTLTVSNIGGGQAHNNMPPYLVVYVWKRTA